MEIDAYMALIEKGLRGQESASQSCQNFLNTEEGGR